MTPYWLTFTDGTKACCEGESAYDAKRIAEHVTGKKVAGGNYHDIDAKVLPYPAEPLVWQFDHPAVGKCPPFCYSPNTCAGRSSCPRGPACSE